MDKESLFEHCFRGYRAYLAAAVSAVDAYLNDCSWFASQDPSRNDLDDANRKVLQRRVVSVAGKLGRWPKILFGSPLPRFCRERDIFHKIRKARNLVIHADAPEFVFSMAAAAEALNWCREGVGGLLIRLEEMALRHPSPAMLATRNAPLIRFNPREA